MWRERTSSVLEISNKSHGFSNYNHVEQVISSPLPSQRQFVFSFDLAKSWPHEPLAKILDWVKHNLHDEWVDGALFVLRILSREYEFKSDEERTLDDRIVEEILPHLLEKSLMLTFI